MKGKVATRYVAMALSVALGAFVVLGRFDASEVPYVVAFQNAVAQSGTMWIFEAITITGDFFVWAGLALLLLVVDFRRPREALKLLLFLASVSVATALLKYGLNRPRPFQGFPDLVRAYANEDMASYPTGDVARAAGGTYLLARGSKVLNAVFALMVLLLALSRVALGVHYFTDTLGAALLSYPLGAIVNDLKLFERLKV
jgi:membrane-associated phospholipid phosphatase